MADVIDEWRNSTRPVLMADIYQPDYEVGSHREIISSSVYTKAGQNATHLSVISLLIYSPVKYIFAPSIALYRPWGAKEASGIKCNRPYKDCIYVAICIITLIMSRIMICIQTHSSSIAIIIYNRNSLYTALQIISCANSSATLIGWLFRARI